MNAIDDHIRHAAMERFGLVAGTVDYTLDRVVRVVSMACACRYGVFFVIEAGRFVPVAQHGDTLQNMPGMLAAVGERVLGGDAYFATGLQQDPTWAETEVTDAAIDSIAIAPVFAATNTVIGGLVIATDRDRQLDNAVVRRLMNDCVRLLEDSLMLRQRSVRDPLTGLYNRRFFDEQIAVEWRRSMRLQLPLSIALIDIDHFKAFNDTAGHLAGDQVIIRVAQLIESRVRRAGDIACRFGGEEFALFLPSTTIDDAQSLCENITHGIRHAAIEHPGHPDGDGRHVTVSIGISSIHSKSNLVAYSPNDVIGIADDALYAAKRAGRDCIQRKLPQASDPAVVPE